MRDAARVPPIDLAIAVSAAPVEVWAAVTDPARTGCLEDLRAVLEEA